MSTPSAALLGEPVLLAAPVSPFARRAPGRGAWGHEPLTGAQVRLLVVTATRVAVLTLDRDVGGPVYYRPLQIEIEVPRDEVRGVELGTYRPSRRFTVVLTEGRSWHLEVTTFGRRLWGPIITALGQVQRGPATDVVRGPEGGPENQVVSPDARA
ncbi:hypothetical protein [Patulibacter minatonensis]|uniref:hypothetical protein n=1 Tax=Patulibacter minatonensis TaxID=298163 RepID=UPI0012FA1145|nr:hypothetical protein [Patulibacter minatonensis]